jgi:hypothetical protein
MTEQELKDAIGDGRMENTVHKFWTKETIVEAGRKKVCPKVIKLAWKKYVESVKDIPNPQ